MTKSKTSTSEIRLPALEIRQAPKRLLYSFAVDGKLLPQFSTISRLSRDDERQISGYQRPEVLSHIADIRNYLESESPLLPNAIVVAFDKRVQFEPASNGNANTSYSRPGTLVIPTDESTPDYDKPGWIVDGQQRAAAIRDARVSHFPICVVAFIARNDSEQREQFILVNSTKPLPKGLIYELLPTTTAKLPRLLERRRFPARLSERLNLDEDSPLHQLIKTPTNGDGLIADNSILKMLENSLTDGVLYRFRNGSDTGNDEEAMLEVLTSFWTAVRDVFPKAWGLPPRRSRLMHGAGVVGMGFLMDAIADRHREVGVLTADVFVQDLEPMKDECRWTEGFWDFGPGVQRKWNEIQNTPKDIQLLANYLLLRYKALVWNQPKGTSASKRGATQPERKRASK